MHRHFLLTANRNQRGADSLGQVLKEECTPLSLPVITLTNPNRLLRDSVYRLRCAMALAEIVLEVERFQGVSRMFIPF